MSKIPQSKLMIKWMKDLWNFPRSLTGYGNKQTLDYLKKINPDLNIHFTKSRKKVYDWIIPDEWNIYDGFIKHSSGKKFADFKRNNLHILGYSSSFNAKLPLNKILSHIHTEPNQPDLIPYVTSYYKDRWGFCMSENQKKKLPKGNYQVFVDSTKKPGRFYFADLLIKGKSKKEIFFSTYICHPSMANNELSGPALSTALIKYIKTHYSKTKYSYRFVFLPETIGSIVYINKNLKVLQKNMLAGFNLSCVGDNRQYSYIPSRHGNEISDQAIKASLQGLKNVKYYEFLDRGSDERQYCSPGVDLPVAGFCRTKYGEYPEYHTSADNFNVVTEQGLSGSFKVMRSIIDSFEEGLYPISNFKCEPNLGKRDLYPTISQKNNFNSDLATRLDLIAYSDGKMNLFEISLKIRKRIDLVIEELKILKKNKVLNILK